MSHHRKKNPPQRRKLDEKELDHLEWLAGIRLPQDEMASAFKNAKGEPMTPNSFEDLLRTQPAARHAIAKGRQKSKVNVRDTLFQMAVGQRKLDPVTGRATNEWKRAPDIQALKFWCATQEQMRTTDRVEHFGKVETTPNVAPQIIITIPSNGREVKE